VTVGNRRQCTTTASVFSQRGLGFEPPTSLANGCSSSFRLRRLRLFSLSSLVTRHHAIRLAHLYPCFASLFPSLHLSFTLLRRRSVPFPPPRSQVAFTPSYLPSTCNLSLTLLRRRFVPFPPPRSQPSTCTFDVLPQTPKPSSNRDRTCAKLLSDKGSLHEQRGPASFDFKQTLAVQLLHSLCSVASSSSVGYA
jgi:hypothetical protein